MAINLIGPADIAGGTIEISAGTVYGAAASGAASSGNPVPIAGTDSGGTVYSMLVDTAGNPQVDVVSIPQVSVGTLPTINVNTGTISVLPDLPGGTVDLVSQANVTVGTFSADVPGGTVDLTTRVGNLGTLELGSVVINSFGADLPGGTMDLVSQANVTVGTFSADIPGGTIDRGTVQNITVPTGSVVQTIHVLGTGGGTFVGTLVGPQGAGTSLYLTGLSIVGRSGTADCGIANNVAGTTGAGVYARGAFQPGGGIARTFDPPINLGTNGTLAYFLISAGTSDFTVDYIVST